jgi:hypothetical protein
MASVDQSSRGMLTGNGPIKIVGQQKIRPRRTRRIGEHKAKVLPEGVRPAQSWRCARPLRCESNRCLSSETKI